MRVVLKTMDIDRVPESATHVSYKLKLRIILRNETGQDISIGPATWKSGNDKMQLQPPPMSPLNLQVETDLGWGQEQKIIEVPEGREFRTWIGMSTTNPDKDFLKKHVERRLGELQLAMRMSGQDVTLDMLL